VADLRLPRRLHREIGGCCYQNPSTDVAELETLDRKLLMPLASRSLLGVKQTSAARLESSESFDPIRTLCRDVSRMLNYCGICL
jgi:hypothetical protein